MKLALASLLLTALLSLSPSETTAIPASIGTISASSSCSSSPRSSGCNRRFLTGGATSIRPRVPITPSTVSKISLITPRSNIPRQNDNTGTSSDNNRDENVDDGAGNNNNGNNNNNNNNNNENNGGSPPSRRELLSTAFTAPFSFPFLGLFEDEKVGECRNEQDLTVLKGVDGRFKSSLTGCMVKCLARAQCVANCVKDAWSTTEYSLTQPCATCFGEFASCGRNSCFKICATSLGGSRCHECTKQACLPSLFECSGLKYEEFPQS